MALTMERAASEIIYLHLKAALGFPLTDADGVLLAHLYRVGKSQQRKSPSDGALG